MNIFILTGAGISAESGLGTFRDKDGLWTKHDLSEVATPEGFARDPAKVHAFYNARRKNAREAQSNAAHAALVRLEQRLGQALTLCTQNVDGLHEQAGHRQVIHMHGALDDAICAACNHRWTAPDVMAPDDPCPSCDRAATRPDIVWFGEMPMHMERLADRLLNCDLFVAIGTSGEVYPAAGFVAEAAQAGADTLELNLEPSAGARLFQDNRYGPASQIVPAWVDYILAELG